MVLRERNMRGLRILVYDDTCRGKGLLPGLTHAWMAGALLYRLLGRIDRVIAARSWEEALGRLHSTDPGRRIREIQFWGHGKWGLVRIGGQAVTKDALEPGHPLRGRLAAVRERLAAPDALWWFRTCETFGARSGHSFAKAWTDFFGCRAAGHTCIVAFWQSGLHSLRPGREPDWSVEEGIETGTPDAPIRALWSKRKAPNTVSCLAGSPPPDW